MKALGLILAIAMFPVAMYSGTIAEDTITAGNGNDYHPSFSRTGLYLNTDDEWLVFDRQTEDSSFIVAKRFLKHDAKWDSGEVIVARSSTAEMLTLPDIGFTGMYGLIGWQKKSAGTWNLFASTWSQYTKVWSSPLALTSDTLCNTGIRIQPLMQDSQFVIAWQNKRVIRMKKFPLVSGNPGDTIAVSNIDSAEFDLGCYDYYQDAAVLYEINAGGKQTAVSQTFKFYPSFSVGVPDTVKTSHAFARPRFVQHYDQTERFVYEASDPVRPRISDIYLSSVKPTYTYYNPPVRVTTSPVDTELYAYTNARAFFFPYVARVGKNASAADIFPYNHLIVCERIAADDTSINPTVMLIQKNGAETIISNGYNRNPVVNASLFMLPARNTLTAMAVWESNRTGQSHLYGKPFGTFVLGAVPENNSVPSGFALMQNYPNPFNPSTTITFSIPTKEFVTLKIFDALGREVSTLALEELQPGMHERRWNAAGMASGMYFYRLQAGSYTETRKLMLLK